jgi:hypothetical protein
MLKRYNSEPGEKFPSNPSVKTRPGFNVPTSLKSPGNDIAMSQTARKSNKLKDAVSG